MYFYAYAAILSAGIAVASPVAIIPGSSNTQSPLQATHRIPTVRESAILARRILRLEGISTLSTVFPNDAHMPGRPSGLDGTPIGLMDYYADCEPERGDPTLLALTIATSFRNVAAGSNLTMSLQYHAPSHLHFGAASLPRFALMGHLENLSEEEVSVKGIRDCFVETHSDAHRWTPGNEIHESRWTRLVVDQIYWVGGFGDRAYIGWIPVDTWRNITQKEILAARLPGEMP